MSGDKNKVGEEFFKHSERKDGTRDLYYGEVGSEEHGHAVIDKSGNVRFIRESDGRIVADDKAKG